MRSLAITLAGILLLCLSPGGLCQGSGAHPSPPSDNIDITYTVSDGVNNSFNDSICLTLPQGSYFFNVMQAAQEHDSSRFRFTYTLTVYGAYIDSVRGIKADPSQRTYWQLLSNGVPLKLGAGCYAVSSKEKLEVRLSKY